MPLLQVALKDDFKGDTVIVHVGGKEAFRGTGVRTDYARDRAARFDAEVPEGEVKVEVDVEASDLTAGPGPSEVGQGHPKLHITRTYQARVGEQGGTLNVRFLRKERRLEFDQKPLRFG